MRPRAIIFGLAGVLLVNALIVLGVWLWLNQHSTATRATVKVTTDASLREISVIDVELEDQSLRPVIPVAAPFTPSPASGMAWAEFDSPREGEAVSRRFRASGRCDSLPSGSRLMLVVDSGRSVFSPKLPPVTVDGKNWSGSANEFGAPTGGSFSLCLFVVSEEAVAQFTEWHIQGRATGKYPPFRGTLPGGTMLARIKLRVASP
jgi:hypothetical protein